MRDGRPSETALKVATSIITLAHKPGWGNRLPPGMAELTERLILAAGVFGYGPTLMRASKRRWMVALYEQSERIMPGIFQGIGERKLFMNSAVEQALDEGASQVLVLGAGFDTLCLRLAAVHPGARFIEIDHPATAAAKRRGVATIGQPPNMTLIAADLAEENLVDVLAACGDWDPAARSVVVMEGLLYYLTFADVRALFASIREATGPGTEAAFSHRLDKRHEGWAQPMLQILGEPWLSSASIADLPAYIGEGWQITETNTPAIHNTFESFALAESLPRDR